MSTRRDWDASGATNEPGGRRSMAAGHALVALLVCFAVAALLSAAAIERHTENLPFGATRSLALVAARPLAAVSSALALDRPGRFVQSALGRSGASGRAELRPLADSQWPAEAGRVPLTDTRSPKSGAGANSPGMRAVTRHDPLVVFIGGDSMAGVFAPQMAHMAAKTGLVKAYFDFHLDSGLVRSDVFDWPLRLRVTMRQVRPDAVVVLFGANDNQSIRTSTGYAPFGSADWKDRYRQRVDGIMTQLTKSGRQVFWVGQPIMREAAFSRQIKLMNDIYRREAARHPAVTYVDSWPLFAAPDGTYSAYLRDGNGVLRQMRLPDGVHLTGFGADRLSAEVLKAIARVYGFELGRL